MAVYQKERRMVIPQTTRPRRMLGKNVSISTAHEEWIMGQAAANGVNFSEVVRAVIDRAMEMEAENVDT